MQILEMNQAYANSSNNLESHVHQKNQYTTNHASMSDYKTNRAREIEQVFSEHNAKVTSKPTSKPHHDHNNISEFSTTQHRTPSARMSSNDNPSTKSPRAIAEAARNFPVSTKNIILGDHRSGSSSRSNSLESICSAHIKPHTGGDVRWDAINMVSKGNGLDLSHFKLLKRVGYGDIGSVYLVELKGTKAFFAMKVMDKAALASRNKLLRAQTEREILGLLDHPFLPTLYSYFETDKYYCLVMEFCSSGSLHSLRMKQPNKHFTEEATRLVA